MSFPDDYIYHCSDKWRHCYDNLPTEYGIDGKFLNSKAIDPLSIVFFRIQNFKKLQNQHNWLNSSIVAEAVNCAQEHAKSQYNNSYWCKWSNMMKTTIDKMDMFTCNPGNDHLWASTDLH